MICHDSVLVQFTPIFARDWTKIGPKTARSRRLDHDQKSSMKRGRHPRFGRTTGANRSDRPAVSLLIAGLSNPNCRGSWTSLCKLVAAARTRVGSTQRRRDRGERQGGHRARICADFSLPSSCLTPAQAYLADVCSAASPTAIVVCEDNPSLSAILPKPWLAAYLAREDGDGGGACAGIEMPVTLRERHCRAGNLARARGSTQLQDEFSHLGDPSGRRRMTARDQSA
jgi:hypothetical protein